MEMATNESEEAQASSIADLCYTAIPAEPQRLPGLRRALVEWAEGAGISGERLEALALVCYEALANAVAHAYSDGDGVVDVRASYRQSPARVEITVTDYGQWRAPGPERGDLGGRGLVLIRSLADDAEVSTGESGTTVRMTWNVDAHSAISPGPSG
jgi:serine/threonine-protein kinase RsbW